MQNVLQTVYENFADATDFMDTVELITSVDMITDGEVQYYVIRNKNGKIMVKQDYEKTIKSFRFRFKNSNLNKSLYKLGFHVYNFFFNYFFYRFTDEEKKQFNKIKLDL